VDEILRLDGDNSLKLREAYDSRTRLLDEFRRREAVLAELQKQYRTKEDYPAALAYIDKQLTDLTDVKLRYSLERRRYDILEWAMQYAEALEALRGLLQSPQCPVDDRNWMLRNQAILLKRLGRLDEALAFYDTQIAAAAKEPPTRAYFLNWKVNMLFGTGRHDQIIATCQELRTAEKPKTYGWAEATFYLAWSFQNAGRHDEAISVYQDQLVYDREIGGNGASSLLAIARSHHALGHPDDERRTLDEVDKVLIAQGDRPAKQKEVDGLREQLRKAREALVEKSPN
ncbi:MAG TPA: tetratricopeptide repeat protein, partial [Pirellulales bacterium]|jgi:tetratricopeptide (TPR) repeat protein|nr:tetratricopeptide repeat protein [Pirellulales bacterium]